MPKPINIIDNIRLKIKPIRFKPYHSSSVGNTLYPNVNLSFSTRFVEDMYIRIKNQ
ncbi:hypothetical protein HHA03_15630 [Halolactibacillus halophilus]|uniref:Uncharacterized protein n=1 Tax=Halolactibacillus halophilus TaxID=306540 RepID=A0ABQ0VLM6_9BACI|nr:hypothetical protein HHA03_15630 [Halolactibacillus halophilus]